jgi:DnaJ-class molecular chaperone
MQDPHAILGLTRDATPDQIRAAYRRLARQLHPDVSTRPDAARRFAAVAEAYELLTDPRRSTRNHPGPTASPQSPETAPDWTDAAEAGETYDAFFRSHRARAARKPPPFVPIPGTLDLELDLPLSVTEAAEGVTMSVPTPTGPHEVRVPAGTPDARAIRLTGLGARGRAGVRGDLIVRVRIVPGSGAGVAEDVASD